MISTAGTRSMPWAMQGSSFWQMMARRLNARGSGGSGRGCRRRRGPGCVRWSAPAVEAWTVPKTRCPVSAAWRAAWNVSWSRISPTSTTSGSSRIRYFSAASKSGTSMPISRWLTRAFLSLYRYSMGSSMVTMWQGRRLVDVLEHGGDGGALAAAGDARQQHQPLARSSAICSIDRRQVELLEVGDVRRHPPEPPRDGSPRWRKMLMRKRSEPANSCATSMLPCSSRYAHCLGVINSWTIS